LRIINVHGCRRQTIRCAEVIQVILDAAASICIDDTDCLAGAVAGNLVESVGVPHPGRRIPRRAGRDERQNVNWRTRFNPLWRSVKVSWCLGKQRCAENDKREANNQRGNNFAWGVHNCGMKGVELYGKEFTC